MNSFGNDEEVLLEMYHKYPNLCRAKRIEMNQSRLVSYRAEMIAKISKYLICLNSSSYTVLEKDKACNKAKALYGEYCGQKKFHSDFSTDYLNNKIEELLVAVCAYEGGKLTQFRRTIENGAFLNLAKIFEKEFNICQLVAKPAQIIAKEFVNSNDYTVVGEDLFTFYKSATGTKYHVKDCVFCKGRALLPVTRNVISEQNLTPCPCVEKQGVCAPADTAHCNVNENENSNSEETAALESTEVKAPVLTKETVSVFVDESVRTNAWNKFDSNQPARVGVYSYIACRGSLATENQITIENTWFEKVGLATNLKGPDTVTIEAITDILMQLTAKDFHGGVVIYTDNMSAMNTWHKSNENKNLSKYFSCIKVCYIPRKENSKADALGRSKIYLDFSESFVKSILARCKGYEAIKELVFQHELDSSKLGQFNCSDD